MQHADDLKTFITDSTSGEPRVRPLRPPAPVRVESIVDPRDTHVEIRTPRLRLRPLNENDRSDFCAVYEQNRAHLERFLPLGSADQPSSEIFERQLDLTLAGDETGKAFRRIATDLETGAMVGAFNFVVIRRGLEWDADTSCWLAKGHTGRGLAAEGLGALLAYAFADLPTGLGIHAVNGFIAPDNTASQALAMGFGFQKIPNAQTHLTVGDRWQVHEMWTLPITRWQGVAS